MDNPFQVKPIATPVVCECGFAYDASRFLECPQSHNHKEKVMPRCSVTVTRENSITVQETFYLEDIECDSTDEYDVKSAVEAYLDNHSPEPDEKEEIDWSPSDHIEIEEVEFEQDTYELLMEVRVNCFPGKQEDVSEDIRDKVSDLNDGAGEWYVEMATVRNISRA